MFKRIILSSLVLSGCAAKAYEGRATDASTVYFEPGGRVSLFKKTIDGVEQDEFELGIAVLPGDHDASAEYEIKEACPMFSLGCIERRRIGTCTARITTGPNKNYGIRIASEGSEARLTVYEKNTGSKAGDGECRGSGDAFDSNKYRGRMPRAY